jgi:hypothetical protein
MKLSYTIEPALEHCHNSVEVDLESGEARIDLESGYASPATRTRKFTMTKDEIGKFRTLARSLVLPTTCAGIMGLDGTTYHLAFMNGFMELELRWWQSLPAEWIAITPLVGWLDSLFDRPTT